MTKEMMFEDLLAPKRSAGASSEATAATSNNPVWHETGGLDVEQLKMVSWTVVIVLSVVGAVGILAIIGCVCYCWKSKNKKKQHAFGIKKNYFRDRVCKPRNPAPVSNPTKGAHYLKKTPSPTGHKSPLGHPLSSGPNNGTNGTGTAEEYRERKPLLAQVSCKLVCPHTIA
jgi:hypothetical protein